MEKDMDQVGLEQFTSNLIGSAVEMKFEEILGNSTKKNWKVLSAMVMTDQNDKHFVDVICLNTGSKIIQSENILSNGNVVIDSHAEVLSRRSLILYIYRQIQSFVQGNNTNPILERLPSGHGLRLKSNYKFHLFLSTAPCGGGRVFSLNEPVGDAHPNRLNRNQLRVKLENGEGSIPVSKFDPGSRLGLMSCSDKIALWNVVGVQGSLLSYFVEPIYLSSIVLVSVCNNEHLVRILNERLNPIGEYLEQNQSQYRLNKLNITRYDPKLNSILNVSTNTPKYALNWIKGEIIMESIRIELEVLYTEDGIAKYFNGNRSVLSKGSLFRLFHDLLEQVGNSEFNVQSSEIKKLNYRDAKNYSKEYKTIKDRVKSAFQQQQFGDWKSLGIEVDRFYIYD